VRLRLLIGAVGVLMGAFGLLRLLQHDLHHLPNVVLWLAGGVAVHDGILAPLTIGAVVLGTRVLPQRLWLVVATGLVVLATVTITAIPVLGSWGARPDNPTLLDRNYVAGWVVLVVLVILVSLVRLTPRWRRLGHRDPRPGGE
jgi:hypothetical protein